jgi:zinc protease
MFFILFSFRVAISAAYTEKIGEREILENGLILLHSEKKSLPIVRVVVAVKAGNIVEPPEKAGLANLTADLLIEGTSRRSSQDIKAEIEFVGGSLNTSGGYDYMTINLSVLKKDLDLGFDLLADIILNPSFAPDEIKRRKKIIKNSILQKKEDPGAVAAKNFSEKVFDKHPYGRQIEGTEETLVNINRKDLKDFHSSYYIPNNSIMAVVGDVDSNTLKSFLNRYFRDWRRGQNQSSLLPTLKFGGRAETIKIQKNITQANIILGHLGIKRDSPDYYAVSVMNYILGGGGFASRLMDNIRDNKGLSYSVYSYFYARKYAGYFHAELQTKNQLANSAVNEILKEMERIRTEPVTDKELNDARSYLTGNFPLRINTNKKIAEFLTAVEYYELGPEYIDDYKKFINSVTKNDILRVAQKYLNPKNYVLVVVGDIEETGLDD